MILTEEKFRKTIVSRLVLIWFDRPHIKYRAIAFLMYRKIQGAICVIITLVMLITAASLPASTLGAPNDGTNLSKKDLKSLSNCQAKSAKDGNLTQLEVTDCYNQLFPQGQSAPQGISANGSSITKKDLKSLSNCQAKSAKDGDLTQLEITDCYNQLFPQGQSAPQNNLNPQGNTTPNGQSAPQNNLNPQGNTTPNGQSAPQNNLNPQGNTTPTPNGQSAPQNNLNPQGNTTPNGKTLPEGVSLPTGLGLRDGQGYSTNIPLGPHGEADEKLK
jgi:hypothetical protein